MTADPEGRLAGLEARVVRCTECPRLVEWRERTAREKRPMYRDEPYWGRPVPGFGDPAARLLVVGLAPAAHGANRTGRMFTGDRSGEWLYRALYRQGFASRPESRARGDGLVLRGAWVTSVVKCAPPANRPTPEERDACSSRYLEEEWEILAPRLRVAVCLGAFAWNETMRVLPRRGVEVPSPRPRFGHGAEVVADGVHLLGSYHPSQQNTFTGRLTESMLDAVFARARVLAGGA